MKRQMTGHKTIEIGHLVETKTSTVTILGKITLTMVAWGIDLIHTTDQGIIQILKVTEETLTAVIRVLALIMIQRPLIQLVTPVPGILWRL